ncbi:unnamed protein product [Moneuplotes crassus]|uniref:Uncharacterized protein n=1 Tax=Euplotes crassus TaxID=5936 RepID=A0AAD1UB19_EUPCR|nr:unnamed protein product [Moneuplotes crassus]
MSKFDLSISGIAIVTSIAYFMNYLVPMIYVTLKKDSVRENSMRWINKDSFFGLWQYMRYGIPSMMLTALEYWSREMITIFGGFFGEKELGACVILFNTLDFVYMIPLGFCYAANALISNSLGAMNPNSAKVYRNLAAMIGFTLSLILGTLKLILRYHIPNLFTQDEEIIEMIITAIPLISLSTINDYTQGISQGTVKAMGIQNYATILSMIGYWGIFILLTIWLTFKLYCGICGIFGGLPIALLFVCGSFLFIIYRTDTVALSQGFCQRLRKEEEGCHMNRLDSSKSANSHSLLET